MSIESREEPIANREVDIESARKLIEESAILSNDAYSKKVVENGGLTDNGITVDVGNFLAAREAVLEKDAEKMSTLEGVDPEALREAMRVVNSVRPDLEEK